MDASRDTLLSLRPPLEVVEFDRGDGALTFYVQGLTAKERDDYEQGMLERDPKSGERRVRENQENFRSMLVLRCLVTSDNGDGKRLLSDDDLEALGNIDATVINELWTVARKVSGMDTEEEADVAEDFASAQDGGNASA